MDNKQSVSFHVMEKLLAFLLVLCVVILPFTKVVVSHAADPVQLLSYNTSTVQTFNGTSWDNFSGTVEKRPLVDDYIHLVTTESLPCWGIRFYFSLTNYATDLKHINFNYLVPYDIAQYAFFGNYGYIDDESIQHNLRQPLGNPKENYITNVYQGIGETYEDRYGANICVLGVRDNYNDISNINAAEGSFFVDLLFTDLIDIHSINGFNFYFGVNSLFNVGDGSDLGSLNPYSYPALSDWEPVSTQLVEYQDPSKITDTLSGLALYNEAFDAFTDTSKIYNNFLVVPDVVNPFLSYFFSSGSYIGLFSMFSFSIFSAAIIFSLLRRIKK